MEQQNGNEWALQIKELAMECHDADEYLQWNNLMNELAVESSDKLNDLAAE